MPVAPPSPNATAIATAVAQAIPAPPSATDIATAVIGTAPAAAGIPAAVAGTIQQAAAPTAAETFHKASKSSVSDYKVLQKLHNGSAGGNLQ